MIQQKSNGIILINIKKIHVMRKVVNNFRILAKVKEEGVFVKYTIKQKFILSIVLFVAAAFTVLVMTNYLIESSSVKDILQKKLEQTTTVASQGLDALIWAFDDPGIKGFGEALFNDKEVALVEIQDHNGRNLFSRSKEGEQYKGEYLVYNVQDINHDGRKIGVRSGLG